LDVAQGRQFIRILRNSIEQGQSKASPLRNKKFVEYDIWYSVQNECTVALSLGVRHQVRAEHCQRRMEKKMKGCAMSKLAHWLDQW
jgi:hypothetical protein